MGVGIDISNQLIESLLVGKERQHVDEVDSLLGKVGEMVYNVKIIHHFFLIRG
jgi:hypothetical protein